SEEMLMLVIANARVFGGGFKVAPRAELGDGQLDLVAFTNMPRRRRFPLMISLLRGTHERAPEVRTGRAEAFHLRFTGPPTYERDGEWNRAGSSEIAIGTRRAAPRVLVPPAPAELAHAEARAPAPAWAMRVLALVRSLLGVGALVVWLLLGELWERFVVWPAMRLRPGRADSILSSYMKGMSRGILGIVHAAGGRAVRR